MSGRLLRSPVNMDDAALHREAVRLYRRYQSEIVEALTLCPWAERARLEGQVREEVVLASELDAEPVLAAIDVLARDGSVQIGLVLFPRLRVRFETFERFVSQIVTKDAERRELGTAPFALAAFHPDARVDLEIRSVRSLSCARPLIRRSSSCATTRSSACAKGSTRGRSSSTSGC